MQYVTENTSRAKRCYNIALAIVETSKANPTAMAISSERLRNHIRTVLKMPKLSGEDKLGDLRANGDAVGKHGLYLATKRCKIDGSVVKLVMLDKENVAKCEEYIRQQPMADTILL